MTKSLLQQLYDGEIYPAEQIVPKSPEYRELSRKLGEEKEYLREQLLTNDRERFEEMETLSQKITSLYGYENFLYGFGLGVGLMIETLTSGNGLSSNIE
ncbi:MAG: hypothetical protein QM697_12085 [Lachnospiraceae bacterium]